MKVRNVIYKINCGENLYNLSYFAQRKRRLGVRIKENFLNNNKTNVEPSVILLHRLEEMGKWL